MRLRFAPAPTGYLHIGNCRTALFNYLYALKHGGTFTLRIDDTGEGVSPEFEKAIVEDLKWLGLSWDKVFRQSERKELYDRYFEVLKSKGLVYPCFCTKEELEREREKAKRAGKAYRYSGKCRKLAEDERDRLIKSGAPHTWRFAVSPQKVSFHDLVKGKKSFSTKGMGDFIIKRSNGTYTYLFSSVVDDIELGITHILRGEDHLSNTPLQILLFEAFEADIPFFGHFPLIKTEEGKPLSKREKSRFSIRTLKEEGYLPEAVNTYLFNLGRKKPEEGIKSLKELAEVFEPALYTGGNARFQIEQLKSLNKEALAALDEERLVKLMEEFCGISSPNQRILLAVRENAATLSELCLLYRRIASGEFEAAISPSDKEILSRFLLFCEEEGFDIDGFIRKEKVKKGKFYKLLRTSITGLSYGPPLDEVIKLLGEEEVVKRIRKSLLQ